MEPGTSNAHGGKEWKGQNQGIWGPLGASVERREEDDYDDDFDGDNDDDSWW